MAREIKPNTGFSNTPLSGATPKSKELKRFIELLCDPNLTFSDVDVKMLEEFPNLRKEGWRVGTAYKKFKQYPTLARTVNEGRALLWRDLCRSKRDAFKAISDALDAESFDIDGNARPNHDIRLKASDRMLALMGESTSPAQAKVNIALNGGDSKILIMSSGGGELPFPMREEDSDGD